MGTGQTLCVNTSIPSATFIRYLGVVLASVLAAQVLVESSHLPFLLSGVIAFRLCRCRCCRLSLLLSVAVAIAAVFLCVVVIPECYFLIEQVLCVWEGTGWLFPLQVPR